MIKFCKTREDAVIPSKAYPTDSGYDITILGVEKVINSNTSLYKTGIRVKMPHGFYCEIFPRSSISKTGYMISNSAGIIDSTYSGEIFVALTKTNEEAPDLKFPCKIGQLIPRELFNLKTQEVSSDEFEQLHGESQRKDGGFGSTDKLNPSVPKMQKDEVNKA